MKQSIKGEICSAGINAPYKVITNLPMMNKIDKQVRSWGFTVTKTRRIVSLREDVLIKWFSYRVIKLNLPTIHGRPIKHNVCN